VFWRAEPEHPAIEKGLNECAHVLRCHVSALPLRHVWKAKREVAQHNLHASASDSASKPARERAEPKPASDGHAGHGAQDEHKKARLD